MADAVEFKIKLDSDLSPVVSREATALRQLDAQLRQTARAVEQLEAKETAFKGKAAAAFERQTNVVSDLEARLASARSRVQELNNSGTPPAMLVKAKEQAADLAGKLEDAKAKLQGFDAAVKDGSPGLARQKQELDKNQRALEKLRPELALSAKKAEEAAKKKEAFAKGLQAIGGPAEGVASRLENLKEALGSSSGLAGIATGAAGILAVALLAVVAAAVAGAAALFAYAFSAASAARNMKILGEALTGSAALGAEFTAVVNQLAREVPLAKDKIAELAREMSLMRLARRDLQAGLTSVAIVTSAIGDAAGSAVKSIIQTSTQLRRFTLGARDMFGEFTGLAGTGLKKVDILGPLAKQLGVSVQEAERQLLLGRVKLGDGLKALEAATRARFGKTIQAQMLDFNVQIEKAKEAFAGLFEGVNLEPILGALKTFLSVLDTSTVTGKALRGLLVAVFKDIGSTLETVGPLAKRVFQGMLIAGLQVYLAFKPIVSTIAGVAKSIASILPGVNGLNAGKAIIYTLAAAFVIVAASIALALLPLALLIAAAYALGLAFTLAWKLLVAAFDLIKGAILGAVDAIGSISLTDAAGNIVDSFVTGLVAAGGRALAAAANLAGDVAGAFKAALKIGSPSKLFMDYGEFTAEGYTLGVEAGQGDAQGAVQGLVAGPPTGTGAAGGGGSGDIILNFNGPVTIGGGESKEAFAEWLIGKIRASRLGGVAEAET